MAIRSAPYYWVECDECGRRLEDEDCTAWGDPQDALYIAQESDWETGDRHLCPECRLKRDVAEEAD